MAGYNLQQILGYVTLTGLIQATKSGIPNTLPPAMMKKTRDVIGDSGRYTRVTGERRTARITKYGSSALQADLRQVGVVDVKLLSSFEKQPISPIVMQQIRNYESYEVQRHGLQEVTRQVKEFGQKFQNLRTAVTLQVLANGVIYIDSSGNLLPSSSGAAETYTFGMNANNQNQLNSIITASWSASNTNIPAQLVALEQRAAQLTGYPLKYAFYGANIPTYFTNNDFVVDYLARQPSMSVEWLDNPGVIPSGLFGYTWVPVYTPFFEDSSGTNQAIWDGDKVVFTPEISDEWWEVLEGSSPVPTNLNIQTDAVAGMNSLKFVNGMYSYGVVTHDPPGVMTFAGDLFLPVLRNADCVFQADTTI